MRRSQSLAAFVSSLSDRRLSTAQSDCNVVLELQRVSYLFQGASFISEAEFVMNCKMVMNMLQYSNGVEPQQQALLVDVIENAVITFIIRVIPLVFQELISPTSLLHPISPPMIISLLQIADTHISKYGDFTLQLRMAAINLLMQDSEDVTLAFSMCQMLPKIQPTVKWQPVINPVKANPVANARGSISLPEIHPPVFPESPSLDCSSLFGSPIPSLSSLLNCTTSSISAPNLYQYDPNHVNVIAESISLPTVSLTAGPTLTHSSSTPNLQNIAPSKIPTSAIIPPVIASEKVLVEAVEAKMSPEGFLLSPSLFSPITYHEETGTSPTADGSMILGIPDICVGPAAAEDDYVDEDIPYPHVSSFVSEDDLSRLISCPDVGEEPPSPSLFGLNPDAAMLDVDLSLSIGPPLSDIDFPASVSSGEPILLSPLPTQISSPLSSPPQILVSEDSDVFCNIFELDVQKRPPSPYNKRLRSASNNPLSTMKRAVHSIRAVSASSRRKAPLDPDLAALTLPLPPNPKKVSPPNFQKIVGEFSLSATAREKRRRTVSATYRPPSLVLDAAFPLPAPPNQKKVSAAAKRNSQVVIDVDTEPTPSRRSQRSTSASVNKENS